MAEINFKNKKNTNVMLSRAVSNPWRKVGNTTPVDQQMFRVIIKTQNNLK